MKFLAFALILQFFAVIQANSQSKEFLGICKPSTLQIEPAKIFIYKQDGAEPRIQLTSGGFVSAVELDLPYRLIPNGKGKCILKTESLRSNHNLTMYFERARKDALVDIHVNGMEPFFIIAAAAEKQEPRMACDFEAAQIEALHKCYRARPVPSSEKAPEPSQDNAADLVLPAE